MSLNQLIEEFDSPSKSLETSLDAQVDVQDKQVIPIIYQPSVDALKNFVREIHCAKGNVKDDGSYEIDVSLLFNNERLRQHGIFNSVYAFFRRLVYGREMDLESFKILVGKDPPNVRFTFEGIYSNNNGLNADSIHGDTPPPPAPERPVKYNFINHKHPIVFVNTANHAMAEHDTNKRIWKFEYIPFLENAPVKLGSKTREEIEKSLKGAT